MACRSRGAAALYRPVSRVARPVSRCSSPVRGAPSPRACRMRVPTSAGVTWEVIWLAASVAVTASSSISRAGPGVSLRHDRPASSRMAGASATDRPVASRACTRRCSAWVIALGCLEGGLRRDAVFLRTPKVGGRRRISAALRLTKVEGAMALALYACVGLLATLRHAPWILVFLVFVQAMVYTCAPVASVWNLFAQGTPDVEYRRRWEERRLREQRRPRPLAWLPRPAFGASLAALGAGGVAAALLLPVPLLSAT